MDQVGGKKLNTGTLSTKRIFVVGPTKQGNFGVLTEDDDVYVCTFRSRYPRMSYTHSYKDSEGAILTGGVHGWYGKKDWKDYEDDQPTALTMDEETGYFYGGTQSGKLHCYSWFTNESNEGKTEWHGATFPVSLDNRIDDIELGSKGNFLWVLSNNRVYRYQLSNNRLEKKVIVPLIPSEDVVDITPERMLVLRLIPNEQYILLGGTKGTVFIADVQTGHCFMLTKFEESEPVADMWWQEDAVVLLNRAGKLRKGKVKLADAGTFFKVEE